MQKRTSVAADIELSAPNVQYDAHVKRLLSNKEILAYITSKTIRKLNGFSPKEIIPMINGEPEVGTVSVGEGETNAPRITGYQTEDAVPYEGIVTFDIRFSMTIPSNINNEETLPVRILINLEAQKDFYPGYDLVTRGVYYAARQISSQNGREFTPPKYDSVRKVYSIWICMNAPAYAENTITSFHFTQDNLVGSLPNGKFRYDLMEIIMVALSKTIAEQGQEGLALHRMLEVLLSEEIAVSEKKQVLESEFSIPMNYEIGKELEQMCNLSEAVLERGIEKGIEQGIEQLAELVLQVRSGKKTIQQLKEEGISDKLLQRIEELA